MKDSLQTRSLFIRCFLTTLISWPLLLSVNWHNNPNITASVYDDNIDIQGTNQFTAPIYVGAINTDITATVSLDSILTGSLQLYFFADVGRTITFDVTNDLIFRGSQSDLLITFSGGGNLDFLRKGGEALSFLPNPTTGAGAQFFVIMDTAPNIPTVTFGRFPIGTFPGAEANLNAYTQVGANSVLSFLSPSIISDGSPTGFGVMRFDPSNVQTATGRDVLQVNNGGAVVISGRYVDPASLAAPTFANIDFTTPAGLQAIFDVINTNTVVDAWSGLMVVNTNTTWTQLVIDPFCEDNLTELQHGFVLGSNGLLQTENFTYLDYVVAVTNVTLNPAISPAVLGDRLLTTAIKDRNPAAFIVDGSLDVNSTPAAIDMLGKSGIFFRSGVDIFGNSTITGASSIVDQNLTFTVNPADDFKVEPIYATGTLVFDVEGIADVTGQIGSGGEGLLNILSLQVTPTGGSLFIHSNDVIFPLRTYNTDINGAYLQYGSAAFIINNFMNLTHAAIKHDDENHAVYQDNIVAQSASTYIGGESRTLGCPNGAQENKIAFYNSVFSVHTDVASTGVDFGVPNDPVLANTSFFVFYQNGRCIDQGSGRNWVFGTDIGSLASDTAHIISRDSHLDIFQTVAGASVTQELQLTNGSNNSKVVQGLTADVTGQFAVQTIFLGNASNISIGTNGTTGVDASGNPFALTTFPTLNIVGDYFSFMTQGGTLNQPSMSMSTGEGGMFVDTNGVVEISSIRRAFFGMMVTKSRNGEIILPENRVLFGPRVGIAQWRLDLADPTQQVLIPLGQTLSDYTIDWKNITKDWCNTPGNIPYELPYTPEPGFAPFITGANLLSLPVIRGVVEQMQFQNSRLGDQAQLLVDGGLVRELVFLTGDSSAVAPTGLIVLTNDAIVGIGTAHRTVDSLDADIKLGVNGVTLVAQGNAEARLNENTIIDNVAHILTGTSFGVDGPQRLLISSTVPHELRIKSTGVLDLTQFVNFNQQLIFGGRVSLVLEPGAQILLGGGSLVFAGESQLICEPFSDLDLPVGTSVASSDDFRVKVIGSGRVTFKEDSSAFIPRDAILGIESDVTITGNITNQSWLFTDDGKLFVGSDQQYGGAFQVGNTADIDGIITFSLTLLGSNSVIELNSQGFLGFGVGIVNKPDDVPNTWLVSQLYNVASVGFNFSEGTFKHQQIRPTDDKDSTILALGPTTNGYVFSFDRISSDILGGGNLVQINSSVPVGGIAPTTVANASGVIDAFHSFGIISSKATLLDASKVGASTANPYVFTAANNTALFNFLSMNNYNSQVGHTAAISLSTLGIATAGYVDSNVINRRVVNAVSSYGALVGPSQALLIGAVGLGLSSPERAPRYILLNP